jgi:hypothetical protein
LSDKPDGKPRLQSTHRSPRFGGRESICGNTGKTVGRPAIAISGIGPIGAKELGGRQDPIEPGPQFSPVKLCRKGRGNTIGPHPEKLIRKILISKVRFTADALGEPFLELFIVAGVADAL